MDGFGVYHFPSVVCGPIDSTKAKKLIGWEPSEFEPYLKWTSEFYMKAEVYFREARFANEKMWKIQREYEPVKELPYQWKMANNPGENDPENGERRPGGRVEDEEEKEMKKRKKKRKKMTKNF